MGKSGGRKKKAVIEEIRLLDGKRSYNIEIFLGRLKMDPFVVKDILLKMDEQKFNAEQVSKLVNFVPTSEEATLFDGLEPGDDKNLAKAEKFFFVIKNIDKNLPQRLELWAFKMNFDKLLAVEREKVSALRDAHRCIKTSKSLRELFSTILAFGNYMNGGTKKGQAHGFKLKSLSQLTRSKAADNKTTLMEYLYLYLLKKNEKLLAFPKEWESLEGAVSVDIPTLRGNIAQIGAKLNIINNRVKGSASNSIAGDKFAEIMGPFHSASNKLFESVKTENNKLMEDLHALAVFLNEKNDRTGQFLKTLNEFRKQFIFTMKQCEERKKRQEKKKKQEEWKMNRMKSKQTKSNKANNKNIKGLPPPIDEDDDSKQIDTNLIRNGPPPPPKFKTGNKSDDMLANLMRSDSEALMNKLRARRKKMSVTHK